VAKFKEFASLSAFLRKATLQYKSVNSFYEGLAAVSVNGKWDFIDRNGKYLW
jgi:hypothetical protein